MSSPTDASARMGSVRGFDGWRVEQETFERGRQVHTQLPISPREAWAAIPPDDGAIDRNGLRIRLKEIIRAMPESFESTLGTQVQLEFDPGEYIKREFRKWAEEFLDEIPESFESTSDTHGQLEFDPGYYIKREFRKWAEASLDKIPESFDSVLDTLVPLDPDPYDDKEKYKTYDDVLEAYKTEKHDDHPVLHLKPARPWAEPVLQLVTMGMPVFHNWAQGRPLLGPLPEPRRNDLAIDDPDRRVYAFMNSAAGRER
ncbi:hypothetical protein ACPUER_36710, partial [Burkholderia sp. DN3021]|uniref:hypothetical protein n=1 Tax=Burkholderia sp. DN3021 TaxID=3410137 RepID=UPI003C7EB204